MSDTLMADAVASPVPDPEQVRDAFAGYKTHDKLILSILHRGNPEEISLLRQHYTAAYDGDVSRALDSEATGLEIYIILSMLDSAERDAQLADRAILKGDYDFLVEIACTRSPHQLLLVKQAYHARYKRSVEEDVASYLTQKSHKLLVPLISSYRYSGPQVDKNLAEAEAKILHEKILEKDYSNKNVIWILATRSKAQVKATLDHYRYAFGNDISKDLKADPQDLKADPDDQFLPILRTTVKCLTHPEKYFEKVLHVAINAHDEGAIARVLSTRAEVHMNLIIEEYCRKNGPVFLPQLQMLVALMDNL